MPLLVLYPANENDIDLNSNLGLDVVAVHGLNGDKYRTWTCKKSEKLWLQDFLPTDLPRARIMTFGYNAAAVFQNSVADIKDHAREFLNCLSEKREEGERERPLIFLAHSLGGHVVKQALVLANTEPQYHHIFNNTNGVIFFGTPHQGSNLATYGKTLARVPSALALKPSPELLDSLIKASPKLKSLTDDFLKLLDIRCIKIVSFYETKPLKLMRNCVVPRYSALLTPPDEIPVHEHQIPVDADHRQICQFSTPKDTTYKRFVRSVKEMIQGNADIENEHFIVNLAVNPHFTGRYDIRKDLKENLITDRHMRPHAQERYVLYGLGGSGKTQVCLKFAQDHREKFWGVFWIDATSRETAREGFYAIARACEQEESVSAVKLWLSKKTHWLIILDNADDPSMEVSQFFPIGNNGTIVITTRNPDCQKHATAGTYHVDQMSSDDSVSLLLKIACETTQSERLKKDAEAIVGVLGYLALAIIQAGAVLRQQLCSFPGFCALYAQQKKELLESGQQQPDSDYKYSVYTTWEISIQRIENMAINNTDASFALELLRIFSFMHFDGIGEDIFKDARENAENSQKDCLFGETAAFRLMPNGWEQLTMNKALKILLEFSLITVDPSRRISMHPLVHEWSRARMMPEERKTAWEMAVSTLAMSITTYWTSQDQQRRRRALPHIHACLNSPEGKEGMFANGIRFDERIFMGDKFFATYEGEGRFQDALNLETEILRMKKTILPDHHPAVTMTQRFIVGCLSNLYQHKEAKEYCELMLDEAKKDPNYDHLDMLAIKQKLAHCHYELGELQIAYEMITNLVDTYELELGGEHALTLGAKSIVFNCLYTLRKFKQSAKLAEELFKVYRMRFPDHHVHILMAMEYMAMSYEALGNLQKARKLRAQTIAGMKTNLGENHYLTLGTIASSVSTVRWTENMRRIRSQREEVLREAQETLGEKNIVTIQSLEYLAESYYFRGELKKARDLQEKALRHMIEIFGENSSMVVTAKKDLLWIQRSIKIRKVCCWWVPRSLMARYE